MMLRSRVLLQVALCIGITLFRNTRAECTCIRYVTQSCTSHTFELIMRSTSRFWKEFKEKDAGLELNIEFCRNIEKVATTDEPVKSQNSYMNNAARSRRKFIPEGRIFLLPGIVLIYLEYLLKIEFG